MRALQSSLVECEPRARIRPPGRFAGLFRRAHAHSRRFGPAACAPSGGARRQYSNVAICARPRALKPTQKRPPFGLRAQGFTTKTCVETWTAPWHRHRVGPPQSPDRTTTTTTTRRESERNKLLFGQLAEIVETARTQTDRWPAGRPVGWPVKSRSMLSSVRPFYAFSARAGGNLWDRPAGRLGPLTAVRSTQTRGRKF